MLAPQYLNQKSILLAELQQYPSSWVLTPVNGRKQPYRKDWQNEAPLSRDEIARDIHFGRAQGVGIRSGSASGGILCIDFDGPSALPKYLELSGGAEPPLTTGWTSGKQGRWQLAFQVPTQKWHALATKKIATGWDDSGKATEFLEFRWSGCQSVLPGSVHPETGAYNWLPGQSPQECEIVLAPSWMLEVAAPEPEYQPSERIESDPTGNPWDIRNFAHYLNGYREGKRRGWDTCKCPAHNGQSFDSLHIEQLSGAFKCHAGCNPKDVYHAALELAKSRGYQVSETRGGYRFRDLGGWLFKLKQQLTKTAERRNFWGFGRKGEVEVESTPAKTAPAIEYQPGERLQVWVEAKKQGYKYILDTSATGTGKSYDAGRTTAELFKIRQVIYASAEHRNPTTPTLQIWRDLEARHSGLYRDEFGKLRRVSSNQTTVVSPNCGRNELIGAFRSKNISGADTSALVCEGCPNLEPCRAGKVFGYLHDRMMALKQPQLRAHPDSLPNVDSSYSEPYDYSDVMLLWDEAGEIIKTHRSIKVTKTDLERAITDLAVKLPQVFNSLRPLLAALHPYLSGEQKPKYGWKDAQIRATLPKVEGIDIAQIASALTPELDEFLNPTGEYGVDIGELRRDVRKKFSGSDAKAAERVNKDVPLNWLPDFLDILTGTAAGHLRVEHNSLIITLPQTRLIEIAQAAAGNIFLDATASPQDLALKLGCNPDEILVVRQALPDTSNLEVVQIGTVGRLGMSSRRKNKDGEDTYLQKRIDALINQIQQDNSGTTSVIDFKCNTQPGDGKRHWWVDSRGVNDLEDCNALALIGTPCRNLGELEAEFTILYGYTPQDGTERVKYSVKTRYQLPNDIESWFELEVSADAEFRAFVRRRTLGDIHQAIGRLRAHRRPNEQLKVYFIADYPLDVAVTLVKASDFTPEAATKVERVELAIRSAVQQLKQTGQKITQQAIATITGVSQQYISRFRVLLQVLLSNSNSICSKNGEPPPNPEEIEFNGQTYIPLLVQESPAEILKGVITTFEAHGQAAFLSFWDAAPATAQVKILEVLLLALNVPELRSLFAAVGVRL